MKTITSRQNPEIKLVDNLKKAKNRKEQNKFIAEGARTVQTLLDLYEPVQLYLTQKTFDNNHFDIARELISIVSDEVMQKISTSKTPSGLLCVFKIPKNPTTQLTPGLVLANITNPGNMGTLIRTAAAMNIKTVVVIDGTDVWSPKVIQSTAGTLAFVNIFVLSWHELLQQKKDLKLCALVVKDGQSPEKLDLHNSLIVVGNEADGIPSTWIDMCEQKCTLAMPGNTESLNAAIAGSIVLYLAFNI
ncbi:MAG: RNA methyltransferase [Candidatus Dependentiae bacterium]